ncbi:MAG: hypothetical protein KGK10_06395 [Rhodospirillales bacterium]|nr:hypothetical protein [Rhodospirillales bacterium]
MKWLLPMVMLLALGACSVDPFTQDQFAEPGTWAPTNDNDANLRAMVANPHDLIAGRPMDGAVGAEAVMPVDKLMTGKRKHLPNVEANSIYGSGSSAGGAGSGGGSNGGG